MQNQPLFSPNKDQWDKTSDDYEFLGLFYEKRNKPFRRILDIRRSGFDEYDPDLLVIMMNPGGSHPKIADVTCNVSKKLSPEKKYKHLKSLNKADFVPTCPDQTQWKIVEFMKCGKQQKVTCFKYARVLNLSDICKPKLEKTDGELFQKNSIFSSDDYIELINDLKITSVLLAWGTDKFDFYDNLAAKALHILKQKGLKIYGYRKPNTNYFYHPLIRPNQINKLQPWLSQAIK